MDTKRLETFFDAVLAIILTVMVLEIQPPTEAGIEGLKTVILPLTVYAVSFLALITVWINHHHMFSIAQKSSTRLVWLNVALIFTMSLVPFLTAWVIDTKFSSLSVGLYGFDLLLSMFWYGKIAEEIELQIFGKQHSILLFKEQKKITLSNIFLSIAIILTLIPLIPGFVSFILYIATLIVWLAPSSVFQTYHELQEEGIDINDDKIQFKIAFSEKEQQLYKERYLKFLCSEGYIRKKRLASIRDAEFVLRNHELFDKDSGLQIEK